MKDWEPGQALARGSPFSLLPLPERPFPFPRGIAGSTEMAAQTRPREDGGFWSGGTRAPAPGVMDMAVEARG